MPCKLENDYSEYDDPDDFFPDIPTLVPWYSINCTSPSEVWKSVRSSQEEALDKILEERKEVNDHQTTQKQSIDDMPTNEKSEGWFQNHEFL